MVGWLVELLEGCVMMRKNMIDGGRPYSPIYNCLPDPCILNVYTNYTNNHLAHVNSIRQDVRTGQRHGFNSKGCECQAFAFQRRISSSVRDLEDKDTTEVLSVNRVWTDRISKTPDQPQVSWKVLEPPLRDGSSRKGRRS